VIYSKVSLRHFLGSLVNATVYQISYFLGDTRYVLELVTCQKENRLAGHYTARSAAIR
jgi:hypothetical protein